MDNYKRALDIKDEIVANRRHIHANPEVGFDLPKTTKFVKEKLIEMGYEPEEIIENGLVCTVGKGGKTFLLRADMDALPMQENSGLDFASTVDGACHACGHDSHTAMLLGAAKLLKEKEDELKGTIKLMFQPAEELLLGAEKMVEAGVLENPKVDAAMMVHVYSNADMGISYVKGPRYASSNNFRIKVSGVGAHGAQPENGVDPIMIGANIIMAAQELISREVAYTKSAVLTMGHFEGGSAVNIIPPEALIEGTTRSYSTETQKHIKKRLPEIASNIAKAYRGSAEVEYLCDCPIQVNDIEFTETVLGYIDELSDGRFDIYEGEPATGSEDFAFIGSKVPSCALTLGAKVTDEPFFPLHNPKMKLNEEAFPIGAAVLVECATRWLEDNQE